MTSGVYRLTFSSGNTYIGKSVNMENRWKQHIDKMRKGTAASAMQAEWDQYGEFSREIMMPCHPDHIDLVEACIIARLNPKLNGDRPADPFPALSCDELGELFLWFGMSTLEHVNQLSELTQKNSVLEQDWQIEHDQVLALTERRYQEEILADVDNKITALKDALDNTSYEYAVLETKYESTLVELERLKNRSFWKKLFD